MLLDNVNMDKIVDSVRPLDSRGKNQDAGESAVRPGHRTHSLKYDLNQNEASSNDSTQAAKREPVIPTSSDISQKLYERLKRTSEADLNLEVFLPTDLLATIAKDIMKLSLSEPCGFSGCVVHVNLHRKSMIYKLGKIEFDPDAVPTFELFLTLVEDEKCWHNFGDLMVTFLSRCLSDKVVYISQQYNLGKSKLYRSPSLSST